MDRIAVTPPSQVKGSFHIRLLGPFTVQCDEEALTAERWPRPAQSLLKLLALAEGHQRRRDEIIDLLWPDSTPEAGTSNLRHNLHVLRREMGGAEGEPAMLSERGWMRLNPAYTWDIDVDRLLAAAAEDDTGQLEEAAQLYRGEPLIEDRYEEWAAPAREHLQQVWHAICLRLARCARQEGAFDAAVSWAERALASDPLDEGALQELLRSLGAGGKRSEALRRYKEFERLLAAELGVSPSTETESVAAGLGEQEVQPGDIAFRNGRDGDGNGRVLAQEAPAPPARYLGALPRDRMVARGEELDRIETVLETVEAGAGRLILVMGEEGIGKTRLAQEVMIKVGEHGFSVLAGRCSERRSDVPLLPFREMFQTASGLADEPQRRGILRRWPALGRLLTDAEGSASPTQDEIIRVSRALSNFLAVLADDRPLAILFDDLQWMDEKSLDLLADIVRHTQAKRVLYLATYREPAAERTSPLGRTVRELDREGVVTRIPLRRLTEEGTAELVRATIGEVAAPAEFAEFVHRRTKGNPFFIERMLRGLGGRYRLVRQIGAGGMGRVFEAVDIETDLRVAVKLMFARTEAEPRAQLRFEQEATVLAGLNHPNIVQVYGSFIEEHASCIVMELLDGQSLRQLLQSEKLDLLRIKSIAHQVTAALACAHDRGIAHRDIKPDNIMVLSGDRVKVTDFGVARILRPPVHTATMTSTGMTMGTPLYMSPEQIEGKQVDGRTDIYALGAVLYEMVVGHPPFTGDDALAVAIQHVRAAPQAPSEVASEVPADWDRLILTALAKEPADRFATVESMGRALQGLSDATITGRTWRGQWLSSRRWIGRGRRAWTAVIAVILIITLALAALVTRTPGAPNASLGRFIASWTVPSAPVALAVDKQGMVYVAGDDGIILKLSSTGKPTGGMALKDARLDPHLVVGGLAIDSARDLYVTEFDLSHVVELSPNGRQRAIWSTARITYTYIQGIVVNRQGTAFVADQSNGLIDVLRRPGAEAMSWRIPERQATVGAPAFDPYPYGLAVDDHGDLYVTDALNAVLVKLSPQGVLLGQWGSRGSGPHQFRSPEGVAVGPDGTVYVADTGNNRLQILSASGSFLGSMDRPNARYARFDHPAAVALDTHGNLYVADTGNSRIDKFSATTS
jgi:DNA-binding SARP family transcriptional activator/DNA-binding beta-propeller fold protein YncE/predicted Ser/Thr protein kinase